MLQSYDFFLNALSFSKLFSIKSDKFKYYTGKHHLDDDLVFLWLLAGMPVLIVSVIWGINELMAWMNGK